MRWIKKVEADGFITSGKRTVITIASDGTAKVEDKVGNVPVEDTPTSDNTMYSLSAWTADQSRNIHRFFCLVLIILKMALCLTT